MVPIRNLLSVIKKKKISKVLEKKKEKETVPEARLCAKVSACTTGAGLDVRKRGRQETEKLKATASLAPVARSALFVCFPRKGPFGSC